ncbi:hypothetical protein EJB05_31926, partial [Eragrostis curvula]
MFHASDKMHRAVNKFIIFPVHRPRRHETNLRQQANDLVRDLHLLRHLPVHRLHRRRNPPRLEEPLAPRRAKAQGAGGVCGAAVRARADHPHDLRPGAEAVRVDRVALSQQLTDGRPLLGAVLAQVQRPQLGTERRPPRAEQRGHGQVLHRRGGARPVDGLEHGEA